MSTRRTVIIWAVLLLSGFLLGATAANSDRLTAAAKATLDKFYPDAAIDDIDDREKDDEDIYVVRLKEGAEKRNVLVEVARDGQILEIDEEVKLEDLPERVQRGLKKAFPKSKLERAEMETEMEISYRVDISEGHKKRLVKLRRSGRIFEIEKRD